MDLFETLSTTLKPDFIEENLIKQAREIPYTEWYKIDELINKTTNEKTAEQLRSIKMSKYREEELSANCG